MDDMIGHKNTISSYCILAMSVPCESALSLFNSQVNFICPQRSEYENGIPVSVALFYKFAYGLCNSL